jgi:hypothetical protein
MALYRQNIKLSTFDKVAAAYDAIKPLRGKLAPHNVRPLGDRARKWERIKKINNNCYLLMDGYYSGDDVFPAWYSGGSAGKPTEAEMINLAPIVWRRHRDGTTTIKVRNATGQGAHNGRYSFLDRHLPSGMRFIIRNGKHFIGTIGAEYYLAKSKTAAKCALPKSEHRNRWNSYLTSRDDGVALTFRVDDDKISFVDGGKKLPVPPKVRVDKKAKAKMKGAIAEFREWAFTMYPLLPVKDREYADRMRTEVRETLNVGGWSWDMLNMFDTDVAKHIIRDPEHTLRVHFMYALMGQTDYHLGHTFDSDAEHEKAVKAQFNRKINKTCGFTKQVRG